MSAPLPPLRHYLESVRDADALLEAFLRYVADRQLELYPAQEEAILEWFAGKNVVLTTPTGSGKSLVALAAHAMAIVQGKRSYYTAPIKALVSEKFFELCEQFGADQVGMMTGDAAVHTNAPILCCTAEILAQLALRQGEQAAVDQVVMDEFHYYADQDRGVAWQIPLLTMPQTRFLLMSATMGEATPFATYLRELNGLDTAVVEGRERPVPLEFEYRETPLHETINDLLSRQRAPIYLVHFAQRAACEQAQELMSLDLLSKEQKRQVQAALRDVRFDTPYGKELRRHLQQGIGVHHAGLLPKYRLLVERLAQQGLLKVIAGTDTLGVGVNIPIRTVLFTRLCKFDGTATKVLRVRDFQQISGRAGRKGFDDLGTVVAQAPEHVIENRQIEGKVGNDSKLRRKAVFRKPPEKGYAHWDRTTFERLIASAPERLESQFRVSPGMVLQLLARPQHGCQATKALIRRSHERPVPRRRHMRTAWTIFRSLLAADVVELSADGVRLHTDLQDDFSLHRALSLFVVHAVEHLDRDAPDYSLDVLTIVESVLEQPDFILQRQIDKLKTALMAELKAQGVEFDERIAELDKVEHPKPRADFIYLVFNEFATHHPWLEAENIRPKSVARDMYETGASFADYVRDYGLQRAEGLLLRYLSDVYKALLQNVPQGSRDAGVDDMLEWLQGVLRQVDSSLIDEWQRLLDLDADPTDGAVATALATAAATAASAAADRSAAERQARAWNITLRNAAWRLVRMLSQRDYAGAVAYLVVDKSSDPWTAERLEAALLPYWQQHALIRTDATARSAGYCRIQALDGGWRLTQTLLDPEDDADWHLVLEVDAQASQESGEAVMTLRHVSDR